MSVSTISNTPSSLSPAASGQPLYMIGPLLGHSQPQTTSRYGPLVRRSLRAANEVVGQRIGLALGGFDPDEWDLGIALFLRDVRTIREGDLFAEPAAGTDNRSQGR